VIKTFVENSHFSKAFHRLSCGGENLKILIYWGAGVRRYWSKGKRCDEKRFKL